MFFRLISSVVSVFHQRMDETRDEIIAIAAHFKRVYSRSVVFLVNAVNRNTTSLSYSKKSSACQHLQERSNEEKSLIPFA